VGEALIFVSQIADHVAIYDVTDLLPKHRTKRYRNRRTTKEAYVHHSGKLGRPGLAGLRNSTRYVVRYRDWPGCPYHYWLPFEKLTDEAGNLVILQAQPELRRTYHAGTGPNSRAIAICLQGNTTARPASAFQLECLGALLHWLALPSVLGHCQAPADGHAKATCPGSHAMAFLAGLQASA